MSIQKRVAAATFAAALSLTVPLAAQLGPCAELIGPLLPDLIIDQQRLAEQIYVSEEHFSNKDCTVVEGCVTKAGNHTLLRFNTSTANIGLADLNIGDPTPCIVLFHLSECHQHLHFENYADYRLWTVAGYQNWLATGDPGAPVNSGLNAQLLATALANGELIIGHKQGFCMVDSYQYVNDGTAGPRKYNSCSSNQGISVGWSDEYGPQLAGQFVRITGLSEGDYVLENHVNPWQLLPESNYSNNSASLKVHYTPKRGKTPGSVEIIE